jgi:hypothetical protein
MLRSPVFKSDYILDLNNFYKLSDLKELCNDQLSIIWSIPNNGDQENCYKAS